MTPIPLTPLEIAGFYALVAAMIGVALVTAYALGSCLIAWLAGRR